MTANLASYNFYLGLSNSVSNAPHVKYYPKWKGILKTRYLYKKVFFHTFIGGTQGLQINLL